ncbi:MAG: hypothetical protein AAGG50_03850 [Bacteroidota bacterium]
MSGLLGTLGEPARNRLARWLCLAILLALAALSWTVGEHVAALVALAGFAFCVAYAALVWLGDALAWEPPDLGSIATAASDSAASESASPRLPLVSLYRAGFLRVERVQRCDPCGRLVVNDRVVYVGEAEVWRGRPHGGVPYQLLADAVDTAMIETGRRAPSADRGSATDRGSAADRGAQ